MPQQNIRELKRALERASQTAVLVEGKNDASALRALGFQHVFILNEHQGSLRERVERICDAFDGDKEICLFFDNDAEGRKLIALCAPIVRELGFRLNQRLRRSLIAAGISHVEGLATFLTNDGEEKFTRPRRRSR